MTGARRIFDDLAPPPAWMGDEIAAPVARIPVQREHALQRGVFRFCRRCLVPPAMFAAWDRSAKHSEQQHVREAARGIVAGWPDTGVLWNGHFIGIELKDGDAVPSKRQAYVGKEIIAAGHHWKWANSVTAFAAHCHDAGVPLLGNWQAVARLQDEYVAADIRKQEAKAAAGVRRHFRPRTVRATPAQVARYRANGVLV